MTFFISERSAHSEGAKYVQRGLAYKYKIKMRKSFNRSRNSLNYGYTVALFSRSGYLIKVI